MLPIERVFSPEVVQIIKNNMPIADPDLRPRSMHGLLSTIQEKERPMRDELERIAVAIVYNNFPIFLNNKPHIKVKAKLIEYVETTEVGIDQAPEYRPELLDEYRKRKMVNMITQGAGISTHGIHHLNDAFKQQNEELVEAYDAFDQLNRMMMRNARDVMYLNMTDEQASTVRALGVVKVEHKNGQWIIDAQAALMPVLIHEIVKGMYELLAMNGLPENRQVCENVLSVTDTTRNEFIDCKYGETIYPMIRDVIRGNFARITDERPEVQEYYLQQLYEMAPKEMIKEVEDMLTGRVDLKRMGTIMDDIFRDMRRDDYEASIQ